ncbi:MAG: CBS domain-containing protein [Rivularia sp. (in: cyanobacteria)]
MTPTNILQGLQYNDLMKMRTVSEVMQSSVIHASPTADLVSIAQVMAQKKISSVVIAQEGVVGAGEVVFPVGIISERDVELLQGLELDLANIQAKTAIGSSLFSVRATDSLFDALSQMQRRNLQQLVVVGDAGELVGILTQSSCLQALLRVKKKTLKLLT